MALDLSSLQKAVSSLERAIKVASATKGFVSIEQEEVIRAGVIQNFEFTYELCWKFMKRWLEKNDTSEAIDGVTMKELFRIAAEHLLIKNIEAWFDYHKARNQTAHIYDERKAKEIFETVNKFLPDAKDFLKTLENKND
ncbi:MAG: nucleotidyltransferase substrate binding protein [Elusimicrobiota bacterium]|nr:nucleotidyltransferase substrate binding protein [Elusimicrobiota bacterium]